MGSLSSVKLFRATEAELLKKLTCFEKDCDDFYSASPRPDEVAALAQKLKDRVWAKSVEAFCIAWAPTLQYNLIQSL